MQTVNLIINSSTEEGGTGVKDLAVSGDPIVKDSKDEHKETSKWVRKAAAAAMVITVGGWGAGLKKANAEEASPTFPSVVSGEVLNDSTSSAEVVVDEEYFQETVKQFIDQLGYTTEQKEFYKRFNYDIDQDEKDIRGYNMRVIDGNLMIDTLEQFDFRVQKQQAIFKENGVDLTNAQVGDLLLKCSADFISETVLMELRSEGRVTENLDYVKTRNNILKPITVKYIELAEENAEDSFITLIILISGARSRQVVYELDKIFQEYINSEGKNNLSKSLNGYILEFGKIYDFLSERIGLPYYVNELDSSGLMILEYYVYFISRADMKTGATFLAELVNYCSDEEIINVAIANLEPYISLVEQNTKTK